jgi:hypothetical protein
MLNEGDARGIPAWRVFEYYCQNLMLQNTEFFDYKHHNGTELQAMKRNELGPSLDVGGCIDIRGTTESLIVAAKRKENIVFYSLEPKYPLIDFVYRKASKLYAFQVTIGADHSCNIEYLKAAIEETGSEYDLLLHYLTPTTKYDEFKLKPVNPFADNPELARSTCTKDWTIRVIQVPSPKDDHAGPSNTMTSLDALKEQCETIGIMKVGGMQALIQRLELVDYKEPDKVDAPTKEKLGVFTVKALHASFNVPKEQNESKDELIQRILDDSASK